VGTSAIGSSWLRRLGWWGYQVAMAGGLATVGPLLAARRRAHYLPTLRGRLGGWDGEGAPRRGGLWLHAVSVGEVGVAATLAQELPGDQPAVVTTVTPTGQEEARKKLSGRSSIAYLPFDLGAPVARFFDRFAPRALVLVEGDYWPLVLREAARRNLPVAVINGRVGDRAFRRMRRIRRFLGPLFDAVARFGVQSADDARRLSELGVAAERIVVTGNLKYESPEPAPLPELEAALCQLAGSRRLLVAGSTMPGEEELVLDAFRAVATRALLVLAPRHPERSDEVTALVAARGLRLVRRSTLEAVAGGPPPEVVLLDTLGELAALYRPAAAAFIGGTLVPMGGHNPVEAARWGVPVAVGPSMDNFREMATDFDRCQAWARVASAEALGAAWSAWLDDPGAAREVGERGRALVDANRGALAKSMELLRPILAAAGS
jgi:3-deoxy-D-manno-octulosonic-acid transferase